VAKKTEKKAETPSKGKQTEQKSASKGKKC
jgi:hypothetical protein